MPGIISRFKEINGEHFEIEIKKLDSGRNCNIVLLSKE